MPETTEPIDTVYALADAIALELEKRPEKFFTPLHIARWASVRDLLGDMNIAVVDATLEWMVANRFVLTNGRGGCWVRYRHRPLFHGTRLGRS